MKQNIDGQFDSLCAGDVPQIRIKLIKYKTKMILQIHDELIFEVPKYEIENISKLVKFEMENAVQLSIPLKVDFNWGTSWYDAH